MSSRHIADPIEGGTRDSGRMFRISNLNCWSVGDNEADDNPHGMEIGSFASKWKWKQKMHLIRLRKKTTVPKMYVWELPPSACVGASTICVWR